MKKLLTVSLFAIMAVSAANADIASTKYVDDAKAGAISAAASEAAAKASAAQAAAEAKVAELDSSLSAVAKSGAYTDLTGIPTVDSTFSATSDNAATSKAIAGYVQGIRTELSNGNTKAVEGLQEQINELDDTYVSESEMTSFKTSNTSAIAAAQAQADKGVEDAAAAKAAADAAQADATANAQAIAGLDTTYVSENEMTSFKESNTSAIAAAKQAGDDAQADLDAYKITNDAAVAEAKKAGTDASDALNDYKTEAANTFMDSGEVSAAITSAVTGDNGALKDYVKTEALTESQEAQDTTLKQYADNKASEAQAAAEATAASALAAYKTSNDTAVAAAKQAGDDAQATASAAVAKSQIGASDAFAVTDECKATDAVCSLVVRAGVAGWEKVSY